MGKNMIKEDRITRRMLEVIREGFKTSNDNLITEEAQSDNSQQAKEGFPITRKNPQFSDVREAQEQSIIKTLGENVEFEENALMFYPMNKDLVLTAKINSLNLAFQFRYNDPSGDGCYLWVNALQLTDTNNRTIGKIRDAFVNWKNALIQDGDLIERLKQMAEN